MRSSARLGSANIPAAASGKPHGAPVCASRTPDSRDSTPNLRSSAQPQPRDLPPRDLPPQNAPRSEREKPIAASPQRDREGFTPRRAAAQSKDVAREPLNRPRSRSPPVMSPTGYQAARAQTDQLLPDPRAGGEFRNLLSSFPPSTQKKRPASRIHKTSQFFRMAFDFFDRNACSPHRAGTCKGCSCRA